jgi:chlorite dismutase
MSWFFEEQSRKTSSEENKLNHEISLNQKMDKLICFVEKQSEELQEIKKNIQKLAEARDCQEGCGGVE